MTKTGRTIGTLALLSALVAACSQERATCLTPTTATLTINSRHFKNAGDTAAVDSALPAALFAALTSGGPKAVIYGRASNFTVSLSPTAGNAQWLFSTDSFKQPFDTLTFYYQRKLHFISNACGYTYYYTIDSVLCTNNNLDSVRVLNKEVNDNVKTKHLQLYIKPGY